MKKGIFQWIEGTMKSFENLNKRVTEQSVLVLPNLKKVLQVDRDASGSSIREILSQEGRPVTFFSEKLNDAIKKYYVYD
jgi:hypothetical protein